MSLTMSRDNSHRSVTKVNDILKADICAKTSVTGTAIHLYSGYVYILLMQSTKLNVFCVFESVRIACTCCKDILSSCSELQTNLLWSCLMSFNSCLPQIDKSLYMYLVCKVIKSMMLRNIFTISCT